jgi:hypothetical protein
MNQLADYEIFLRSGCSFTVKQVKKLEMSTENGKITELTVGGTKKIDKIEYISLSDISCIVKRREYTKKWWNK